MNSTKKKGKKSLLTSVTCRTAILKFLALKYRSPCALTNTHTRTQNLSKLISVLFIYLFVYLF